MIYRLQKKKKKQSLIIYVALSSSFLFFRVFEKETENKSNTEGAPKPPTVICFLLAATPFFSIYRYFPLLYYI